MPLSFPPEAVPLLLDWYHACRRDLPWRATRDPYHILVSEIMLQQTRAETVKPYYARFLSVLPTVQALAEAPESTILKLWEGLGYYSRVRNLQKAAQKVVKEYGGVIPADFDKLLSLPGVGRYTAGAVASIAYDIPVPAVDGNVLRVAARLTGESRDILQDATRRDVEACIAPHVPTPHGGDFNQSLIELGALLCLPGKEAKCGDCPVRLLCTAAREGRVAELPLRIPKTKRRTEEMTVLLLRTVKNGVLRYVIRRRPDSGLLSGLYEFPYVAGNLTSDEVRRMLEREGAMVDCVTSLPEAKHLFTHIEWRMRGYMCDITPPPAPAEGSLCHGIFVTPYELSDEYTIPSAFGAYKKVCTADEAAPPKNQSL